MHGYQAYNTENPHHLQVTRQDPFTGKIHQRTFEHNNIVEHYNEFMAGSLIQDAFPYLTPDEREFILTGITPESWDKYIVGEGV